MFFQFNEKVSQIILDLYMHKTKDNISFACLNN